MIQSLSIVVLNKKCINNCPFCVSKMHCGEYKNQMDENLPFYDLYLNDYLKRLEYARDNGVNTIMLTGNSEPQQNRKFLTIFGLMNRLMKNPFKNIEMQTTGILLDKNYLRFLRNHVGVNTISLSISSFDEYENEFIITGKSEEEKIELHTLCLLIKEYDFNLRLSVNLLNTFNYYTPERLFKIAKEEFKADQITFRVLYADGETPQAKYVKENKAKDSLITDIDMYVKENGTFLEILPYGAKRYSVHNMSTVIDDDCMNETPKEDIKYLILQPDCKLYTKWNDKASLVF